MALSKALFAYDAWYTVTFVAEEVHDSPPHAPPGIAARLPAGDGPLCADQRRLSGRAAGRPDRGGQEDRVAEQVAAVIFGRMGSTLVIAAILVSTFGCLNGLILGGARVSYAMARQGLFFRPCAAARRRKTPGGRAGLPGRWSMVLALSGSYSNCLPAALRVGLFGGLMVAAVYRLRCTQPERPRPIAAGAIR